MAGRSGISTLANAFNALGALTGIVSIVTIVAYFASPQEYPFGTEGPVRYGSAFRYVGIASVEAILGLCVIVAGLFIRRFGVWALVIQIMFLTVLGASWFTL